MITQGGAAHTGALSGGPTRLTAGAISGGIRPRLARITAVLAGGAVVAARAVLTGALSHLVLVCTRGTHGTELCNNKEYCQKNTFTEMTRSMYSVSHVHMTSRLCCKQVLSVGEPG